MRVNKIIDKTYAEGPGCRLCIWVQGCNHKCDGCFATDLWDYGKGYQITTAEVIERMDAVKNDIDGITLLGGEPFDQADDLAIIAKHAKSIGKNVIAFTGYVIEQLNDDSCKQLLKYVDVLLDGEFDKTKLDYSKPLIGSSNQRILFLSDDINKNTMLNYKNRFEIRTDVNGKITFNGMGNIDKLKKYIKNIGG